MTAGFGTEGDFAFLIGWELETVAEPVWRPGDALVGWSFEYGDMED